MRAYDEREVLAAILTVAGRTGIPIEHRRNKTHGRGRVAEVAGFGQPGLYAVGLVLLVARGDLRASAVPVMRSAYSISAEEEA